MALTDEQEKKLMAELAELKTKVAAAETDESPKAVFTRLAAKIDAIEKKLDGPPKKKGWLEDW